MDIELQIERSWLVLKVADDGHGFQLRVATARVLAI
jgi:hypothetical protein